MKQINVEFQVGDRAIYMDGNDIIPCKVESVIIDRNGDVMYSVTNHFGGTKKVDENKLFHSMEEIVTIITNKAVGFDITKSNTIRIQRPAVVESNLEENASPASQNDNEGATPTDAE